jgi:trk system potassium uptake protein
VSDRDLHVVIVGCGRVGSGLAARLVHAGYTVAVIDRRPEAFRRLAADLPVQRLAGVGFDRDTLKQAGVERATALAAVTNGDNSNIVIARVARERFEVPRVLARIYDPRRAAIYERLGITTVATVRWTIEQVLQRLTPSDETVSWTDPSARVLLVERELPPAWAGRRVSDVELPGVARVVGLSRLGSGIVLAPDHVAQEGDVVYVAVAADRLAVFDGHLEASGQGGRR